MVVKGDYNSDLSSADQSICKTFDGTQITAKVIVGSISFKSSTMTYISGSFSIDAYPTSTTNLDDIGMYSIATFIIDQLSNTAQQRDVIQSLRIRQYDYASCFKSITLQSNKDNSITLSYNKQYSCPYENDGTQNLQVIMTSGDKKSVTYLIEKELGTGDYSDFDEKPVSCSTDDCTEARDSMVNDVGNFYYLNVEIPQTFTKTIKYYDKNGNKQESDEEISGSINVNQLIPSVTIEDIFSSICDYSTVKVVSSYLELNIHCSIGIVMNSTDEVWERLCIKQNADGTGFQQCFWINVSGMNSSEPFYFICGHIAESVNGDFIDIAKCKEYIYQIGELDTNASIRGTNFFYNYIVGEDGEKQRVQLFTSDFMPTLTETCLKAINYVIYEHEICVSVPLRNRCAAMEQSYKHFQIDFNDSAGKLSSMDQTYYFPDASANYCKDYATSDSRYLRAADLDNMTYKYESTDMPIDTVYVMVKKDNAAVIGYVCIGFCILSGMLFTIMLVVMKKSKQPMSMLPTFQ